MSLGTATPGGGFPVYGEAVAATINEIDPTLEVKPQNTKGSAENMPMLEAGKLDIALVQGEAALEALNGIGRPPADLRILAAMYATPGMFVVRADSPYRTSTTSRASRSRSGPRARGSCCLPATARRARASVATGISRRSSSTAPATGLRWCSAARWRRCGAAARAGRASPRSPRPAARFIVPDADGIKRIQAKHPSLKTLTVPPNSYPGQTEAIVSVGSWSFILARPTLPDEVAYRLARALHKGEAAIAKRLPQARETTAANTAAAAPRSDMLHPGVLKYLRETGLVR